MKRSLLLFSAIICFSMFGKAQTLNPQKLFGVDSIKVVTDYIAPFKQKIILSPASAEAAEKLKVLLAERNNDALTFLNNGQPLQQIPTAKPGTADHMPVLKLGDTANMHYTMLVKTIPPYDDKKMVLTPKTP